MKGSCGKCKKDWTGANRSHCGACHETFSSLGGFDLHQKGNSSGALCSDPATLSLELRNGIWHHPYTGKKWWENG